MQYLSEKILQFYDELSKTILTVPSGFKIINPFAGQQKDLVQNISNIFYHKYYNDTKPRRLILGSSPARHGTAITGIPFEDIKHLEKETGISLNNSITKKPSSDFLNEVINKYGGYTKFYNDFYMNFVCPLGIVKINSKNHEINYNYYDNKDLLNSLYDFIISSIQTQINFGIDTNICFCVGSDKNYNFLLKVNKQYKFFKQIVPLEHPRFIMQYNLDKKEYFY